MLVGSVAGDLNAGGVDQDVRPAQPLNDFPDDGDDIDLAGDIRLDKHVVDAVRAQALSALLERLVDDAVGLRCVPRLWSVADRHVWTPGRDADGNGLPDSARARRGVDVLAR